MAAKNVLQLIHSDEPGGAESVLLGLLDGLEQRGYHTIVGLAGGGWLADRLSERGATVVPLKFRHTGDLKLIYDICRVIRHHKIDVVHTHLTRMDLYGGIAARLTRVPSVATLHGKDFKSRWGKVVDKLIAHTGQRLVAVSNDLATELKQRDWPSDKIRVIYNGIDPGSEPSRLQREEVRRELGLSPDIPVFGSVGRLEPVKAYPILIDALAEIVRKVPEARLLLIGDGSLREYLEAKVRALGLSKNVIFTGTREDARRLLHAMDFFVLCSYSEGLSISLLEAMAAGLPAVTTRVGGNAEVNGHGITGLMVPASDVDVLTEAISLFIEHPEIALKMGERARSRIQERFSLDAMAASYDSLYSELLTNHPVPHQTITVES